MVFLWFPTQMQLNWHEGPMFWGQKGPSLALYEFLSTADTCHPSEQLGQFWVSKGIQNTSGDGQSKLEHFATCSLGMAAEGTATVCIS